MWLNNSQISTSFVYDVKREKSQLLEIDVLF